MHLFLGSRSERGGARRAPTKRVWLSIVQCGALQIRLNFSINSGMELVKVINSLVICQLKSQLSAEESGLYHNQLLRINFTTVSNNNQLINVYWSISIENLFFKSAVYPEVVQVVLSIHIHKWESFNSWRRFFANSSKTRRFRGLKFGPNFDKYMRSVLMG